MDVYVDRTRHRKQIIINDVQRIRVAALDTDEYDEPTPTYWRTITVQTREGTIEIELSASERDPLTVEL